MLEIKNLELSADGISLAKNISFTIPNGSLACILGPSGIGKTTLIRSIAGLNAIRKGTITVNGCTYVEDGKETTPCHLRGIGYVPQDSILFPHMTVKENLEFFISEGTKQQGLEKVVSLLKKLDMFEKIDSYPHQLSGGQVQRVALARAFINPPKILLLDEPLNGIHQDLAIEIGELINKLIEEFNIPAIMITHDLELAEKMGDLVGVFSKEQICWRSNIKPYREISKNVDGAKK